jgi:hypothetical protein
MVPRWQGAAACQGAAVPGCCGVLLLRPFEAEQKKSGGPFEPPRLSNLQSQTEI